MQPCSLGMASQVWTLPWQVVDESCDNPRLHYFPPSCDEATLGLSFLESIRGRNESGWRFLSPKGKREKLPRLSGPALKSSMYRVKTPMGINQFSVKPRGNPLVPTPHSGVLRRLQAPLRIGVSLFHPQMLEVWEVSETPVTMVTGWVVPEALALLSNLGLKLISTAQTNLPL